MKTKKKNLRCLLFVLSAVQFLAADWASVFGQSASGVTNGPPAQAAATNAASSSQMVWTGYVADEKYKLRVGDRFSFQVLEDRGTPLSLTVMDSGEAQFPYIGRWLVRGKSCRELTEELGFELEKSYYQRATLVIALDNANPFIGKIYFLGQVRSQGAFELRVDEKLTVGKAILRAGGFGEFANKKQVRVYRGGMATDGKPTYELNMVEILERGRQEKDIEVQPDDFIVVPSRLINF